MMQEILTCVRVEGDMSFGEFKKYAALSGVNFLLSIGQRENLIDQYIKNLCITYSDCGGLTFVRRYLEQGYQFEPVEYSEAHQELRNCVFMTSNEIFYRIEEDQVYSSLTLRNFMVDAIYSNGQLKQTLSTDDTSSGRIHANFLASAWSRYCICGFAGQLKDVLSDKERMALMILMEMVL